MLYLKLKEFNKNNRFRRDQSETQEIMGDYNLPTTWESEEILKDCYRYHLVLENLSLITSQLKIFTIDKGNLVPVMPLPPPPVHVDFRVRPNWNQLTYQIHRWGLVDPTLELKWPLKKWPFNPDPFIKMNTPLNYKTIVPEDCVVIRGELWRRHAVDPEQHLLYPFSLVIAVQNNSESMTSPGWSFDSYLARFPMEE